jgi:hypothetical protein
MRRSIFLALVLVVSACGGSPGAAPATTATSSVPGETTPTLATTTTSDGVAEPDGTSTTVAATTSTVPRVPPEGRDAPDFTLALGEGGEFTLSDEHRPVFLLFWAEW